MKTKDYREIQVSSSLLAVIFLTVLVLGVFIFLLGVSVGKRQVEARAAAPAARAITNPAAETAGAESVQARQPAGDVLTDRAAAETRTVSAPPEKTVAQPAVSPPEEKTAVQPAETRATPPEARPSPATASGLFYIQVGAFNDRAQALNFSRKFKTQGYTVLILDPFPGDRRAMYRVRVGGYADRAQAADVLTKLNAAENAKTGYYITRE